jgi:hypothetical protein
MRDILKSKAHRDTSASIYYHKDTTACTHANVVTLFFYIITSVEVLVPAGNRCTEAFHKGILLKCA